MANEIKSLFGSSTALTITLASLATSTTGVGRQSTLVDNSSVKAQKIQVYFKVTTGTSPTTGKSIRFYLIKGDNPASSNIRTDNADASDAAFTVINAPLLHVCQTDNTSDETYSGSFIIANPGPEWGIAVVHDTGVNLNSTAGNHDIRYVVENPEIQ